MRRLLFLLLFCSLSIAVNAQKKNKGKEKTSTNFQAPDSLAAADSLPPPPAKSSKKGKESSKSVKSTNFTSKDSATSKSSGKKGKDDKKGKKEVSVNFKEPETEPTPVADTSKRFTGIIKYRMTTDDPVDKDSMFIIFGENQIRVTMFTPGYREGQIFEDNSIINFLDSTLLDVDVRSGTYKKEKLGIRNPNFEITLSNSKKTTQLLNIICQEYKGEMTDSEDAYEAACLISDKYQYMYAMDYNYLNIQAVVKGYKIVLGWRTKSQDNQNTYIMAYKIEPGDTSPYFDLSRFQAK